MSSTSGQHPNPSLDRAIVQKAAQWMARLWADDACEADQVACRRWRAAHPDHEIAWQRLQAFDDKLEKLPPQAAPVLMDAEEKKRRGRRRAIQALTVAALTASLLPLVRDTHAWRRVVSDHSTKIGEIRRIVLPDGTHLWLNTSSSVDVEFDDSSRVVHLRTGEILVTTYPDPATPARPFLVHSPHGTVRALGTHFSVRLDDDASHVAVYEGAVRIQPELAPQDAMQLDAGLRSAFSSRHVRPPQAAPESEAAWRQGLLVAENMRVIDFLHELGRYRTGLLRCSPEAADMLVTGVFPLTDTDRALANLELALPVRLDSRTRYWVTINARHTDDVTK